VGQGAALRRHQGGALLRPLRHRVVEPRARAAAPTRTSRSRRCTCGSRRRRPTTTCSSGRPPRGRSSPTRRRGRPDVDYVRVRAPVAGGTQSSPPTGSPRSLGDSAEIVGPSRSASWWRALRAPVHHPAHRRGREPGGRRRLRHHGDGSASCTSRPHSARSPRGRDAEGLPLLNPSTRRPGSTQPPDYTGTSSSTPTPRSSKRSARPAGLEPSSTTPTRYRTVGVAAPDPSSTGRSPRGRAHVGDKDELLAQNETIGWTRVHQSTAVRRLAREQRRLALSATGSGHPIPGLALRHCGHDTCVGSVCQLAEIAHHYVSELDSAPAVRRQRGPFRCEDCGGDRGTASSPCSTRGSTPGRCRPRSSTNPSRPTPPRASNRASRPLHLRGHRPDPGWFYSISRKHASVWLTPTQRGSALHARRRPRDGRRRCSKQPGQRHRPLGRCSTPGADALHRTCSAPVPWTPKRVFPEAIDDTHTAPPHAVNTYSFFVTYANIDGWTPAAGGSHPAPQHVLDAGVRSASTTPLIEVDRRPRCIRRAARRAGPRPDLVDDLSTGTCAGRAPRF